MDYFSDDSFEDEDNFYDEDDLDEEEDDEEDETGSMNDFIVNDTGEESEGDDRNEDAWSNDDLGELDGIDPSAIIDARHGRKTNSRMVLRGRTYAPERYVDDSYHEMMLEDADYDEVMAPLHGDDGVINSDDEMDVDDMSISSYYSTD